MPRIYLEKGFQNRFHPFVGRPREIEKDLEIFGGREIDIMIILLLDREIVR